MTERLSYLTKSSQSSNFTPGSGWLHTSVASGPYRCCAPVFIRTGTVSTENTSAPGNKHFNLDRKQ